MTCSAGEYLDATTNSCVSCGAGCEVCTDSDSCTTCMSNSAWNVNQCECDT
jgi:hypothetical protein